MKKLFSVSVLVVMASTLAWLDTRRRYDVTSVSFPFANSLSEAVAICKQEAQKELSEDLVDLRKYGISRYHTDKEAIRQVISIPCDTNTVQDDFVSRDRGLDLGEICLVGDNAKIRVQKLIPDEYSIGDPNWNKPTIENALLAAVHYPCKNGNGCEEVLTKRPPIRWVVRDPRKCNLRR